MTGRPSMASSLSKWRQAFEKLDQTPWPGTNRIDDPTQLRGRKRDVSDIAVACLANDLLVIHGASGVGKSSLLTAGLIPELRRRRKTVVYCNRWDAPDDSVAPSAHITEGVLEADPFSLPNGEFESRFGDRLVIVLDQFEEVIRNNPEFAQRVLRWIEDVVGTTSARFVVSLRSEQEHELAGLYTKPFARRGRVEIPAITNPRIIELIIGGPRDSSTEQSTEGRRLPIADDAIDALREAWQASQADENSTKWDRPGLLHLQAALYVLWMRRSAKSGGDDGLGHIALTDVTGLIREVAKRHGLGRASAQAALLAYALELSVSWKVENCESACMSTRTWQGVPAAIVNQTKWIFRDITEHLSSGGYKTPRDMWELSREVIGHLHRPAHAAVQPVAQKLYNGLDPEWLSAREVVQTEASSGEGNQYGLQPDWLGAERPSFSADMRDGGPSPRQLGSGPAAGLTNTDVMFELFRCYFFALEWLKHAKIAQLESKRDSKIVILTHDRYSAGLARWHGSQVGSFKEAVERLASHRGEDLAWHDVGGKVRSAAATRLVVNANWRSCAIHDTDFSGVTFVNCDFAGSTFESCVFDGATFVNCILDQVDFVRCAIKGRPTWPEKAVLDRLADEAVAKAPEFRLAAPSELTDALRALQAPSSTRITSTTHFHLYARESGTPAVTASGRAPAPKPTREPTLPLKPGGLTVCGGRLSSLTFRTCDFLGPNATVSLHHIAGTSLEICEQRVGTFDIFAAGIRGLTVTRPVEDLDEAAPSGASSNRGGPRQFTLNVHRARVINAWFGVNLKGKASFDDCLILQLVNASESFTPTLLRSRYFGLVNAETPKDLLVEPKGSIEIADAGIETLGGLAPELVGLSRNIDFRESVPDLAVDSKEE
ncbi:pentapeptide repeat protein [Nocardioides sp. JS614]|nr:pentapeptide repeat protein [Nocardioides sp. JS614]